MNVLKGPCCVHLSLSGTCRRRRRGAPLSRGDSSRRTLNGERCLHHQHHTHAPQPAVSVCGHIAVCHQLVAISEVPDVVDGGGSFEVATGIVELDSEDHVLTTKENIVRLVDRSPLGDVDSHRDLI